MIIYWGAAQLDSLINEKGGGSYPRPPPTDLTYLSMSVDKITMYVFV